jgi:hypothetical protein
MASGKLPYAKKERPEKQFSGLFVCCSVLEMAASSERDVETLHQCFSAVLKRTRAILFSG